MASQAFIHYKTWTIKLLVAEVPWWRKLQYYTVVKAERTLAAFGIFGTKKCRCVPFLGSPFTPGLGIGVVRGPIAASNRWIQQRMKAQVPVKTVTAVNNNNHGRTPTPPPT